MTAVALSRPYAVPRPIDIEELLQIVVATDRSLGWRRDGDRELSYDRGITAKPRKRPHVGWIEASASAGGSVKIPAGRGAVMAHTKPDPDCEAVLAALDRLDAWTQSVITANARAKRRPDWMEGVEPRLVAKRSYAKRRKKRGAGRYRKPVTKMVWTIDPAVIRAAREIYSRWHVGLERLIPMLEGELSGFRINGLTAPSTPWEMTLEKIA
jgi:hypothetical protein